MNSLAAGYLAAGKLDQTGTLLEAQLSQEVREESSGEDRLSAKITIDEKQVEGLIKEGKVFRIPKDANRHPQTPVLKRSVERAIALAGEIGPSQEPLAEGSNMAEVGTGHWLLGILENAALRTILATIGVDVVVIRIGARIASVSPYDNT